MIARAALVLRPVLLCLVAGVAAAASAETMIFPCTLPVGQRFTFTLEQHGWTRAGAPSRVTFSRAVRFEPDPAGAAILLGAAEVTSDLTGPEARRLALLYAPGGEREARLRLDGQGHVLMVEALERHWADYIGRLERLATLVEAEGGEAGRTRALLAALAHADQATKIAAVDGEIEPLLRHCGQSAEGTAGEDGLMTIIEREQSEAVSAETRYHVSPVSGLAMAIDRRLTVLARPSQPQIEYWRLAPAQP